MWLRFRKVLILFLLAAVLLLPYRAHAAPPAGAVYLDSSKLLQAQKESKRYTCGNLPPWQTGRLIGTAFYPTAVEIKALKKRIKTTKSSSVKKTLEAKIRSLTQYRSTGNSLCTNSGAPSQPTPTPVPTTANGFFDITGNVTAAGKTAFQIPSSFSASVGRGITAWNQSCKGCHQTMPSSLSLRTYPSIRLRIQQSPMSFIVPAEVSEQAIVDIVAFANY